MRAAIMRQAAQVNAGLPASNALLAQLHAERRYGKQCTFLQVVLGQTVWLQSACGHASSNKHCKLSATTAQPRADPKIKLFIVDVQHLVRAVPQQARAAFCGTPACSHVLAGSMWTALSWRAWLA